MSELRDIVERAVNKHKLDITIPQNVTKSFLKKLWDQGIICADVAYSDEDILNQLDELNDRIFVFSKDHRITDKESNILRKDLSKGAYQKIDNLEAVNLLIESYNRTHRNRIPNFNGWNITSELAEALKFTPHQLIRNTNFDKPPIGIYLVGKDRHYKIWDWMSGIHGPRIYYSGNVDEIQDKHYGKGIRYKVKSLDDIYKVTLSNMPITNFNDKKQFSLWLNSRGSCECDHASFVGKQHRKQENDLDIFCKHITAALLHDIIKVNYRETNEQKYRIFLPLLAKKNAVEIVNRLKHQTLMAREQGIPQPLNDIELNRIIGMYIARDGFNSMFFRLDDPIDFSGYQYFKRK